MILKSLPNALVLDKPCGVATHTPDSGLTDGFIEMAAKLLDYPLWAVHRLDNTTSGCLLVTTSARHVDEWTKRLAEGKKKYIFISKHDSKDNVWATEGRIEKIGSHRFGLVDGEPNSKTSFAKLGQTELGYIYEADISTGKTHQIRIHAEASRVPILGDTEHGGEEFFRLMLHAKELDLEGSKVISPLPHIFNSSTKIPHYDDIAKFLVSVDRRRFYLNHLKESSDAFRLVHREWASKKTGAPKLCVEKLGPVLQVLSYLSHMPDTSFLQKLCELSKCEHWFVREMFDRGKGESGTGRQENISKASPNLPLQWSIKENGMKLDLRYNQGLSSGLFLDQRENRRRVKALSQGKRVANIFSYTCGFSIAAALGGAHEVVSVDTSSTSLQWGKDNFKLNDLNPEKYEFFTADALFFLNSCMRRGRTFDIIILDPPTFSRNKNGIFKLKDDLSDLLELAFKCLEANGQLLVTVNDESVDPETLGRHIEDAALKTNFSPLRVEKALVPYDFEFPLERNTVMKGFWVSKLS